MPVLIGGSGKPVGKFERKTEQTTSIKTLMDLIKKAREFGESLFYQVIRKAGWISETTYASSVIPSRIQPIVTRDNNHDFSDDL